MLCWKTVWLLDPAAMHLEGPKLQTVKMIFWLFIPMGKWVGNFWWGHMRGIRRSYENWVMSAQHVAISLFSFFVFFCIYCIAETCQDFASCISEKIFQYRVSEMSKPAMWCKVSGKMFIITEPRGASCCSCSRIMCRSAIRYVPFDYCSSCLNSKRWFPSCPGLLTNWDWNVTLVLYMCV